MAKSRKCFTRKWGHRRIRGYKNAKINKVRRGAQPPDPWDDIPLDRQCYVAMRVGEALHKKGWDDDRIVRHLKWKFRLSARQARQSANYGYYWHQCHCGQCTERRWIRGHTWGIPRHILEGLE